MAILQIRQKRIENRWTQQYVADYIGLTRTAVHDIEAGKQKPSYDVLCKLEDLFHLTHRQLFTVADDNLSS